MNDKESKQFAIKLADELSDNWREMMYLPIDHLDDKNWSYDQVKLLSDRDKVLLALSLILDVADEVPRSKEKEFV